MVAVHSPAKDPTKVDRSAPYGPLVAKILLLQG